MKLDCEYGGWRVVGTHRVLVSTIRQPVRTGGIELILPKRREPTLGAFFLGFFLACRQNMDFNSTDAVVSS